MSSQQRETKTDHNSVVTPSRMTTRKNRFENDHPGDGKFLKFSTTNERTTVTYGFTSDKTFVCQFGQQTV